MKSEFRGFPVVGLAILLGVLALACGCGNTNEGSRIILGPGADTVKVWNVSLNQVKTAIQNATNTAWVAGETSITRAYNQSDAKILLGLNEAAPMRSLPPRPLNSGLRNSGLLNSGVVDPGMANPGMANPGPRAEIRPATLPTKFSWLDKDGRNWMTSVKNQGTFGTCVAFAVCGAAEAQFRIAQNNPALAIDLSEWFLWYKGTLGKSPTVGGWDFFSATKYLKENGTVGEHAVPYSLAPGFAEPVAGSPRYSLLSYQLADGYAAMKAALLKGPLVTGMTVYSDFYYYSQGIYKHVAGVKEGAQAIVVLGFDDEQQYWICKNSWADGWGEQGYFKVVYDNIWSFGYGYTVVGNASGTPIASGTINTGPFPPVIYNPTAGQKGVELNPSVWASAFNDPDPGNYHAKTDWEIYNSSGTVASGLVWFRYGETASKTSLNVTDGHGTFAQALSGKVKLESMTSYWVRVRYYDNIDAPSSWSTPIAFFTKSEVAAAPERPTILAPGASQSGVSLNPTLAAGAFSDNNPGDTHATSDWEVFNSGELATESRVWRKEREQINRTSIIVNTTNGSFENALAGKTLLEYSTAYWVRVRYADQTDLPSPWSDAVFFTTASLSTDIPVKPSLLSPVFNQQNVVVNPVLLGSTFRDQMANDYHLKSAWEVYAWPTVVASARVWSQGSDVGSKTLIVVDQFAGYFEGALAGKSGLDYNTQYLARVRYYDNKELASDWSNAVAFTTIPEPNSPPFQPALTSPGVNQTGVAVNPTLIGTAFSDRNAGDVHQKTDWEVFLAGDLAPPSRVWAKISETVNLTSIQVNTTQGMFENALQGADKLTTGSSYWVRLRYYDKIGAVSEWSPAVKFTVQ
jgi:hypothetical protein